MFEQQSLLLSLECVPEHPNLVKMPSLSRSLRENVLPNTILWMRKKPEIVLERHQRPQTQSGAPNFTQRQRKHRSQSPVLVMPQSEQTRPRRTSKAYEKLFVPRGQSLNVPRRTKSLTKKVVPKQKEKMQYFAKVAFVAKKPERLSAKRKQQDFLGSKSAKKQPKRILTPLTVSYTEEKENFEEEEDTSIFTVPFVEQPRTRSKHEVKLPTNITLDLDIDISCVKLTPEIPEVKTYESQALSPMKVLSPEKSADDLASLHSVDSKTPEENEENQNDEEGPYSLPLNLDYLMDLPQLLDPPYFGLDLIPEAEACDETDIETQRHRISQRGLNLTDLVTVKDFARYEHHQKSPDSPEKGNSPMTPMHDERMKVSMVEFMPIESMRPLSSPMLNSSLPLPSYDEQNNRRITGAGGFTVKSNRPPTNRSQRRVKENFAISATTVQRFTRVRRFSSQK